MVKKGTDLFYVFWGGLIPFSAGRFPGSLFFKGIEPLFECIQVMTEPDTPDAFSKTISYWAVMEAAVHPLHNGGSSIPAKWR